MRLYEFVQQGGPVMWPLMACSIAVLTVIIERFLFWVSIEKNRDRTLTDEIVTLAEDGDWKLIRRKTEGCQDHIVNLLITGILHKEYDMGRAMEAEADHTVQRMNRYMPVLDTMITVTPLLGIFGTVLGIIGSFKILGASGIADPKLVTSGIAQALITTATGLGIAIIAVIPYNFFNSRISRAIHTMEKYATSLEVVFNKAHTQQKQP